MGFALCRRPLSIKLTGDWKEQQDWQHLQNWGSQFVCCGHHLCGSLGSPCWRLKSTGHQNDWKDWQN